MISDKIPMIWDMALRWCKCRTSWIDLFYDNYVRRASKKRKAVVIKRLVNGKADFDCTIDFDKLLMKDDQEQYEYWVTVSRWKNYFARNYTFMKQELSLSTVCDLSDEEKAQHLNEKFNLSNIKLATFILNYINHER